MIKDIIALTTEMFLNIWLAIAIVQTTIIVTIAYIIYRVMS